MTDWLYTNTGQTHQISYARLLAFVHAAGTELKLASIDELYDTLSADSAANGDPHPPRWLDQRLVAPMKKQASGSKTPAQQTNTPSRQRRHLQADTSA